jgi:hypothetical protein
MGILRQNALNKPRLKAPVVRKTPAESSLYKIRSRRRRDVAASLNRL